MSSVQVATHNIGWTKQSSSLRIGCLADALANEDVSIVVVTEASNRAKLNALGKKLSRQSPGKQFNVVTEKIGYDYASVIYDSARYVIGNGLITTSFIGKYLKVELETKSGRCIDVVGTHLPIKYNRVMARKLLLDTLNASKYPTICIGDVNCMPNVLKADAQKVMRHSVLAFDDDETAPTTTMMDGRCYDNCILNGSQRYMSRASIDNADALPHMYGSDHFPIVATWNA